MAAAGHGDGAAAAGWFVTSASGQPAGPYPPAFFAELARGGYVTLDTPVWCQGRSSWDKVRDIEELRDVVAAVPASECRAAPAAAAGDAAGAAAAAAAAAAAGAPAQPADPADELAAFEAEIAAVEQATAAEAEAAARQGTPDELEFVDDDGTPYVWDRQLRRYMPADGSAPSDAQAGGAGAGYDIESMTFVADEEAIPTLAAAKAAAGVAAPGPSTSGGGAAPDAPGPKGANGGKRTGEAVDNKKRKADAFIAEQREKAAKKREDRQKQQEVGWKGVQTNTSVYVTGLPSDVTVEEMVAVFGKCGLIKDDAEGKPRVKLYRDKESGLLKGDALVIYYKEPSVQLAVTILDGSPFRPGLQPMSVSVAKFELKGEYQPRQAPRPKGPKGNKKAAALMERKLGWGGFDDVLPAEKTTVVIKRMFTPDELLEQPTLAEELQEEVTEECAKLGPVDKVKVYKAHPEGVVTVRFRTADAAQACLQRMDGRFFGGRQLEAAMWDGVTNYHVKSQETAEEEQARLEAFSKQLESGAAAPAGAPFEGPAGGQQ